MQRIACWIVLITCSAYYFPSRNLGKSVEELAPNLRFVPLGNYLIFYRPTDGGIEIVRLLHGARDVTVDFFSK